MNKRNPKFDYNPSQKPRQLWPFMASGRLRFIQLVALSDQCRPYIESQMFSSGSSRLVTRWYIRKAIEQIDNLVSNRTQNRPWSKTKDPSWDKRLDIETPAAAAFVRSLDSLLIYWLLLTTRVVIDGPSLLEQIKNSSDCYFLRNCLAVFKIIQYIEYRKSKTSQQRLPGQIVAL